MILEGVISYPGATSAFRNWQPENDFLYELLFASLTTCLVYQLTKIVLDLGLGQRSTGDVLISDLNQFILVSNFSCKSILSSFGCKGFVARRRFHGKGLPCTAETHLEKKTDFSVLIKYIVLLLAAPVIHVLGIYLSVESEKVVHFGDVLFGGAAFGISDNGPIIESRPGSFCAPYRTKYARGETPLANFYRCFGSEDFPHDNDFANDTFLLMLRGSEVDIGVTIVTPSRRWISFTYLDIHTGDTPYRLRNIVSDAEGEEMLERGLAQMMSGCPSGTRNNLENVDEYIPPRAGQWIKSVKAQCESYIPSQIEGIGASMLNNMTMVDAKHLEVSRSSEEPFILANDLELLRRQSSAASFLSMLVAALAAIAVRLILKAVFDNDTHLAVEFILKDRFGMKCCDSMLQDERVIHFNNDIEIEDKDLARLVADRGKRFASSSNSSSLDDDASHEESS